MQQMAPRGHGLTCRVSKINRKYREPGDMTAMARGFVDSPILVNRGFGFRSLTTLHSPT
jgi:hypothetical protein